jgi:hypothetical protein
VDVPVVVVDDPREQGQKGPSVVVVDVDGAAVDSPRAEVLSAVG